MHLRRVFRPPVGEQSRVDRDATLAVGLVGVDIDERHAPGVGQDDGSLPDSRGHPRDG